MGQKLFEEMARIKKRKDDELAKPSPYSTYRDEIFGFYSVAIRLQDLILHLYNQDNQMDLGRLLGNADEKHTEIAIDIIRRYSILGENDQAFMATARELQKRRAAA
jgi:hypothetical protein